MNETPSQTVGPFFAIGMPPRDVPGATATIAGRVLDGAGEAVPDAVVETWQAEGWARAHTGPDGRWELRIAAATEVDVSVFARGLLNRVVARLELGAGPCDIHLQGEDETVFYQP